MSDGGYLYTALTVLLFLSLFSLVLYFYGERGLSSGQENIEHIKTKAIYDDIMFDLEKITNLTSFVNRTRTNVTVTFYDFVPAPWNISQVLWNYSIFIEDFYEEKLATNVTLNVGAVGPRHPIEPYEYDYGWSDFTKNKLFILNTSDTSFLLLGYQVIGRFTSDTLADLIWIEAEDFTSPTGSIVDDTSDYESHLYDWTAYARKNFYVPLDSFDASLVNYTLWVRSKDDNDSEADHRFWVEVNGVNSTQPFGNHSNTSSMIWGWERGDDFAMLSSTTVKLHTNIQYSPYADVIAFKTSKWNISYGMAPPERVLDRLVVERASSGTLDVDITLFTYNYNYTFNGSFLGGESSNWSFIFGDNDNLSLQFGDVSYGVRDRSMLLSLNNTANGSVGHVQTRITFLTY